MTLLHQAAQKAVEALNHAQQWIGSAPHGDNCYVSDHYEGDPGDCCNCGKESALSSVECALSALQQQPEPVALTRFNECGGMEEQNPLERLRFFCALAMKPQDWMDVEQFFAALQQQEVPTCLECGDGIVAHDPGVVCGTCYAIKYRDGQQQEPSEPIATLIRGEGGAFRVLANGDALRAIYALPAGEYPLYASPSTTQQQEVITEDNAGQRITDMLMECAERLGNFSGAEVDSRAWQHLLVYAPHIATQQQEAGSGRVLPHPGSPEASAMLDSLLAEYQWPANSKNAARAGWEAANRWLAAAPSTPESAEKDDAGGGKEQ